MKLNTKQYEVLAYFKLNPESTIQEAAIHLRMPKSDVQYSTTRLRAAGRLRRVERWEVVEVMPETAKRYSD